ncbi:16S rRNA (uracil(1498)-N(3))-methyltransferase [Pseudomonadota bacterium]
MSESTTLTRIYCEADLSQDLPVDLGPGPAHKLRAVLRAQTGDEVRLFNGRDGEWRARLESLGKNKASALCLSQTREQKSEPGPWLAFAPIKKDRLDMIVEKAVELGVERLIPVITRRTESRRVKMERLNQQIIDAAEQCERLSVPEISEPINLDKLASVWPKDRALLVGAERRDAPALPQALASIDGPLGLLVGPEGGFESQELDAALNLPISIAVSLGPRILRAETAAIAALGVVQALSGDWKTKTI